jgi:hypothetical protein
MSISSSGSPQLGELLLDIDALLGRDTAAGAAVSGISTTVADE